MIETALFAQKQLCHDECLAPFFHNLWLTQRLLNDTLRLLLTHLRQSGFAKMTTISREFTR
jgi:hypothetical protein